MRKPTTLLSPRDLGGMNRALVLRTLVDHGPASRSELAALTGVTRASVGTIVQGLLDDRVLEEQEAVTDGNVGKPARPVWFAPGAGAVIAVDLQTAGFHAAVVDARGHVSDEQFVPFENPESPTEVVRLVGDVARRLARRGDFLGVGIAVPGTTNLAAGEVMGSSQVAGAVGTTLASAVGRVTRLPTFVENDSRAQALGEQWFGLGRGVRTFTSVQTGDGLGVGLVLDGSIYRGPKGLAGELGHHAVDMRGERCVCGLTGCWETIATTTWLRRRATEAGLRDPDSINSGRLTAMAADDHEADALLQEYAENLSVGLANLAQILGSSSFILHGDVTEGGESFRRLIEAAAIRRSMVPINVAFTHLAHRASLLGAVAVVLSEELHRSV